jgi:hypothetical protein
MASFHSFKPQRLPLFPQQNPIQQHTTLLPLTIPSMFYVRPNTGKLMPDLFLLSSMKCFEYGELVSYQSLDEQITIPTTIFDVHNGIKQIYIFQTGFTGPTGYAVSLMTLLGLYVWYMKEGSEERS